jgi:hypothetical protein
MPHFLQAKVTGLRGRMRRHARSIECATTTWRAIKRCRNDEEALMLFGKLAYGNILAAWLVHQRNPSADGYSEGYVEDRWIYQAARIHDAYATERQLCVKIEDRAIEEFAGARTTREVEERATEILAQLSLVYFDVSGGEWAFTDSVRVHMVFIDKSVVLDRYLTVIEVPGGELRLVQWKVENGKPTHFQLDQFHRDDDSLIVPFGWNAQKLQPLDAKLSVLGVNLEELAPEIMRLCRLSLVWLEADGKATDQAPRHAASRQQVIGGRSTQRGAANFHDRICFSHVRPRRQRDQRANCHGVGTTHHRVWVTGHFKLQAHGKQRALRKLIWVNEFLRGPNHAPIRRRALIVRPRNPDAYRP